MEKSCNIILLGTGAIGSYYCGKLQQAGAKISAVCRSDYETVKSEGINIKSIKGDFIFTPDETVNSISKSSFNADYIVIATKALPSIDIISLIKPKLLEHTAIILIQNGIDVEISLHKAFPNNEIISCIAFICVTRESYGKVSHADYGRLVIGNYPKGVSEKANHIAKLFNSVGVDCETQDEILYARWKKLIWNIPFNSMSVLANRASTKEIMDNENSAIIAKKIMKEVVSIAKSEGYLINDEVIEKNLADTAKMTPYKTSMLLDFENSRPMEVEAIIGNTFRIAQKNSISVPIIEALYAMLSVVNDKLMS